MRPDLEQRFLKVAHNLDRLEQLRNLVGDIEQTSPRSLIASAAVAGAEFLASATGYGNDTSVIHRAYEEIFAALENSEAVNEMFVWNKVAAADRPAHCVQAVSHLQRFRRSLSSMGGENA
jgi:hypothetical protein